MASRRNNSERERRFIAAYLVCLNGTEAAIKAGYATGRSAGVQAARLLARASISSEIERRQKAIADRYGITVEKVIRELAKIGLANIEDYTRLTEGGDRVIDMSGSTRDELAAVAEIVIEDYVEGRGDNARDVRRTKIKLHDKRAALVDLARHLGLFDGHEPPPAAGTTIINNDNRTLVLSGMPVDELARQYREALAAPAALPDRSKSPIARD